MPLTEKQLKFLQELRVAPIEHTTNWWGTRECEVFEALTYRLKLAGLITSEPNDKGGRTVEITIRGVDRVISLQNRRLRAASPIQKAARKAYTAEKESKKMEALKAEFERVKAKMGIK